VKSKLELVFDTLYNYFGPQHWWPGDSPWEIAVGAILTQQVAWSNVEKAIKTLKDNGVLDLKQILNADPDQIKILIKPVGFYNQKATRLLGFASYVFKKYGNIETMLDRPTFDVREELLSIKGIGKETADSILLYAGGHPVFVIDAYTNRLARCLCISGVEDYNLLQAVFESMIPKDVQIYNEYHALIVRLGKEHCRAKPMCYGCPVKQVKNII